MDFEQPKTRKEKKGNKEKQNKELYGKYNSKFVRIVENNTENRKTNIK